MEQKSPTVQKGTTPTPKPTLNPEFRDVVSECKFFATLPEYCELSNISEFVSVDIHPTKSLVVTGDANNNVVVWDFESKTIIFRTSPSMLFAISESYMQQENENEEIPKINVTKNSPKTPMTQLKSVQFYDNDTLLWSNNSSYTAVPSQYIIAHFAEGFALIDYVAQTAIEVYSEIHLQNLVPNCILPLNDRYLLVGTNGHLCVYDCVQNQIQSSVAHTNVTQLVPYKVCSSGSIYHQHSTNEIQVIAVNSVNMGICWNVAIGSNNEFISIQPSFALADGGLCQGVVSRAVYSLALDKVYLLSDSKTVTVVDCSVSRGKVTYQGIKELGCEESLSSSALTSVTVNTTLLDLAEPLVPVLSSQFVPVVTGTDCISVVDLESKSCESITYSEMFEEDLQKVNVIKHLAIRSTTHDQIAVASCYGVAVFSIDSCILPPTITIPMEDKLSHMLVYSNKQLYHQAIDLVEKPVGSSLSITQPAAVIRSSQAIGKPLNYNEIPQLVFNNDHSKLAIVFEKTGVVVLYSVTLQNDSIELSPLSELKNITSFAWSYIPTKYATIENKLLYISDMNDSSKVQVWIPGESELYRVFGGYFLGVCMNPTDAEMRSSHIHSQHIQFFGWDIQAAEGGGETTPTGENESTVNEWKKHEHLKNIGSRLPAPNTLFYCNEEALLLLSYRDRTAVYRIEKDIELITIVNHAIISCYLICNNLFLLSPTTLLLMVINKKATTTYCLGHRSSLSTLPALQSTIYSNQVIYNTASNPLLPPVATLPTGNCRLLTSYKGSLLMATASGSVVAFPLSHPSIRFIMLIASGQVDIALHWTKKIQKDQHDAVAYVLQSWGFIDKCLELPGLSPSLRLSFQLSREDVPSIIKIIKKGELHLFDEADNVNVDYRITPVDQLPGIRRATLLLAKAGKKEDLKKLFKLCQKNERDEDAEFVGMFLYKEDPSLLLSALKKENKYHDAALLSKMNSKYNKELPDLVQAWNQQLKTEARTTSYLSGVEVVLEESKRAVKKTKTTAASKTAAKGKAAGAAKGEGRRGRRRRG